MIKFLDVADPGINPTVDRITTYTIIAVAAIIVLVVLVGVAVALKNRKKS